MTTRKKLIEVALPLEAINAASAREKSIRHGHPSTLHLWWARRPLAAARAVIFTSLVDDPDDPNAPPEFVAACRKLPAGANASVQDTPRQRLFDFIERLVQWESTTDEEVLEKARELIRLSTGGNPPPLLDPFAGGGSIPLEAQRLGLEAHASDLNPVAVMINKALIEIPPRFANLPPVNPRDRGGLFALTPDPSPSSGEGSLWKGAQGLAADVRYYGEWMRDRAWERIGHLYPKYNPHPPAPSPSGGGEGEHARIEIDATLEHRMVEVARGFRKEPTPSEDILWQSLRNRQLDGRKFRRQQPIGPFVVDFFCSAEKLIVEVDGPIHADQRDADAARQQLIEAAGYRFVRVTAHDVATNLPAVLNTIRAAFLPSPAAGRGAGGEGETVIAWLWARTVKCPNPACGAQMPLVRSFDLSKKKGRQAWVEPIVERGDSLTLNPSPSSGEGLHRRPPLPSPAGHLPSPRDEVAEGEGPGVRGPRIRFTVRTGSGTAREGTVNRRGATCIACGSPVPFEHIRAEGKAGRMGAQLMAIVTEGQNGRNYYAPDEYHVRVAEQAQPTWRPDYPLPRNPRDFKTPNYGMTTFADLFTPRQLVALTTFSDLVGEARERVYADALAAGLPDDDTPLREGGRGARAYAEAVSLYLGMNVSRQSNRLSSMCFWDTKGENVQQVFARQAIPMNWDFTEANPFSNSTGNFLGQISYLTAVLETLGDYTPGYASQQDATKLEDTREIVISTDPPYYDNIGYADLADYFYVWMRQGLREIYPDLFGTLLVPKEPELVATPYRFKGDKQAANEHFEQGMSVAFQRMRGFTKLDYPLTVYYAFKQSESDESDGGNELAISSTGWETMLAGLIDAGFTVNGTWPMRTELTTNLKKAVNALASSIVLVCRPRPDDAPVASRREFVSALRRELPPALRDMQSGSIAPVDLAQAAIGPGMAVYSRYRRVLEADGSPLTVRTALQLINQELDAFLAESEGDVDADTRFCIAWFEQFGFREGEFGVADVLARAKNTSVEGLVEAGVVEAGAGKVRLKSWDELEPGWTPQKDKRATVWEAVHHLIERLNTHGEQGAAALLAQMHSDLAAEAKNLAYRLYQICDRKGWAEHALEYNAVVLSWPGVQQQAGELKQNPPPEQLGLL